MDLQEIIKHFAKSPQSKVSHLEPLRKGMTNNSYTFVLDDCKYVLRVPDEAANKLINRQKEGAVYSAIANFNISDDVVYFNQDTGIKVSKFVENARTCNAAELEDVKTCIKFLKSFHNCNLKVPHYFDLFENIEFYEDLYGGNSIYDDYQEVKKQVYALKSYVKSHVEHQCLCHIDPNCDNFLINSKEDGALNLHLIDWEYAAMQDPHVDLAMFCIYSQYDEIHINWVLDSYFEGNCPQDIKLKIYCYIAICGLLWSNWCEYKECLGVQFGHYATAQYDFAKRYSHLAIKQIQEL